MKEKHPALRVLSDDSRESRFARRNRVESSLLPPGQCPHQVAKRFDGQIASTSK